MAHANISDLTQWVQDYTDDLYNWAYHKVSDSELAQDLVQDVFLAAAEKLDSFQGNSSPKTWLFSILNYKIIDVYRKRSKQIVSSEQDVLTTLFTDDGGWNKNHTPQNWGDDDEHLLDNSEFRNVLENCMGNLPDLWKACIELKFLSQKNGDEICQELDITSTNFWQIVHRAKVKLRNCVETNWYKN